MSEDIIYGVDLSKKVTPIMVRDAIIRCFVKAHSDVLDDMREYGEFKTEEEFEKMKNLQVKYLIETMFEDIGGDFNNPTKEQLSKIVIKLKEYAAASLRKPEVIEKHASEIKRLIEKIE